MGGQGGQRGHGLEAILSDPLTFQVGILRLREAKIIVHVHTAEVQGQCLLTTEHFVFLGLPLKPQTCPSKCGSGPAAPASSGVD